MEKVIGRTAETNKLMDYFVSGKSEFIALYGRRRVGKTFLRLTSSLYFTTNSVFAK